MPPIRDRNAEDTIEPLRLVFRALRDHLERRLDPLLGFRGDEDGYWHTMHGLLIASKHTMSASLFLVAEDRLEDKANGDGPGPFLAQAIMLQRSLLETLANVMALSEHRKVRDLLFRKDGYRETARRFIDLSEKHAAGRLLRRKNARWEEALSKLEAQLSSQARLLQLSPSEIKDPQNLRNWPRLRECWQTRMVPAETSTASHG
jgi:hypothetical protein